MKKFKRDERPDTEWSDPGSTKGIPDRWTQRSLCGLWLNVGNNNRIGPDYTKFAIHESETPWKVFALKLSTTLANHWEITEVASGKATSIEVAKRKAETAARAWRES